ncbi:MAG: hypothetical protein BHK79_00520 [Halanaerobium sp. MDAL1]|nr:MAG: hypothetical protein BHK79_00520 [Halanaerobium sp. MDAL1]
MESLLSGLNPEQKKAANRLLGPVLVLAGAGSGKTRTLTYRTANLIDKGVNPENILTLTFTNKAANNMKEKIAELIGSEKANKIWMGTFHSIGLRILRANLNSIGYRNNVSIYDSADSESLLKSIITDPRIEISKKEYPPARMLSLISEMKNELIRPDEAKQFMKKNYAQTTYDPRRIVQIYKKYEELKKKYNAFDFGDLILMPVYLFKYNPKVLKFYQKKFQYVQIDEYQDSNTAQYVFSKMLSKPQNNIMVVGDDDQAIYGFRGADFRNILNFSEDFEDVFEVKLEKNYRSTKSIVNTANDLIKHNKVRKGKKSYTDNEEGKDIKIASTANNEKEGKFVVKEIQNLVNNKGFKYKDITILYRVNAQSLYIEKHLKSKSIPYEIIGAANFFDRKECQMFLNLLKFSLNPLDDLNIGLIIGYYKNNLGATTIKKLKQYSDENNIGLLETMREAHKVNGIGKKRNKYIQNFLENYLLPMEELRKEDLSLKTIINEVKNISQVERLINQMKNSDDRRENFNQLLGFIEEIIEKHEDFSLEELLEHIKLNAGQSVIDEDKSEDDNKIKLMTVHSSKGLEFPVVFVMGLEEKTFPHSFAVNSENKLAIEEERRLAYVAFTRAEKRLYLTYAKYRTKYGGGSFTTRSRFIDELLA